MKIGDKVTHKAFGGQGQVVGFVHYGEDLVMVEWSGGTGHFLHHVDDLDPLEPTDLDRYLEKLKTVDVLYVQKHYKNGTRVLLHPSYAPDGHRLGCVFDSDGRLLEGIFQKCD